MIISNNGPAPQRIRLTGGNAVTLRPSRSIEVGAIPDIDDAALAAYAVLGISIADPKAEAAAKAEADRLEAEAAAKAATDKAKSGTPAKAGG